MRLSWLLTAVLSIGAILAVPNISHDDLWPGTGTKLVSRIGPRGKPHPPGHPGESGAKDPPLPGIKGTGPKNPNAPALKKSELDHLVETVPNLDGIRIRVVQTRPRLGETAIHEERMSDGRLRYTAYLGDDMHDHTAGMLYREKEFGAASWDAEYRPASSAELSGKRKKTLAGAEGNPKDEDGNAADGVNEEKPPASVHPVPVNYKQVGRIVPPTVIKGTGAVSRKMDSQLVKKIVTKCKEAGPRSTMRFRANPTPEFRANPPKVLPVKGPSGDAVLQYEMDSDNQAGSNKQPRLRSGKRRHSKRSNPFGQAASAQSGGESSNAPTSRDDQENQRYLEAYDAIRSNATAMLMPIIEEMVNGSDSALVWNAAWEIMSLADRSVIVLGGPVFQGMHFFDWWEDSVANKTDNQTMQNILAIDGIFIDLYQTTWNKANDTLTSSGLLYEMDLLEMALNATSLETDDSNANAINEFFQNGPNSTLADTNSTFVTGNQTTLPTRIPPYLNETRISTLEGEATPLPTRSTPISGPDSTSSLRVKADPYPTSE
ncbi:MAG: hypothetical protein Q9170_007408 [Blastenia crenularia]